MRPRLFTVLSAASLLLFIATSVLWIRSYWIMDSFHLERDRIRAGRYELRSVTLSSARGAVELMTGSGIATDSTSGRTRFSHYSAPGGRLIFNSMHRTLAEKLGFRFARGQWGFVHGLAARPATQTVINLPYWLLILISAILPFCYVLRRYRRRRRVLDGLCADCGYDLRCSKDRCPECGSPISYAHSN